MLPTHNNTHYITLLFTETLLILTTNKLMKYFRNSSLKFAFDNLYRVSSGLLLHYYVLVFSHDALYSINIIIL